MDKGSNSKYTVNIEQATGVHIGDKVEGKQSRNHKSIAIVVALAMIALFTVFYFREDKPDIYRVRVTVIGEEKTPIEDAKVWSSVGGEAKKVAGGWQFDIARGSLPKEAKLSIYAEKEGSQSRGTQQIELKEDRNPTVKIELGSDKTASVRGMVVDEKGTAISKATVFVIGYEKEAVETQIGGFQLQTHQAKGEWVTVYAQREGYKAARQNVIAGDGQVQITLEKER